MNKYLKFYCLALMTIFSTIALAQNTISIQSTLKNISGEAVSDGMQSITFKLYTVPENGTSIWEEVADVEVVSGIYSHELGSVTPLVSTDFGNQLYLGVTINNKELAPRTKLGFAPYAMAVNALAGNGQSASFDANGQFIVSDEMSVTGELFTNNISNTGDITTSNKIGVGIGTDVPAHEISIGDKDTGISGTDTTLLLNVGGSTPQMTIKSNGRVGIGITDPKTVLHVTGTNTGDFYSVILGTNFTGFYQNDPHLTQTAAGQPKEAIAFFDGNVIAEEIRIGYIVVASDQRIKKNLKKSNSKTDLDLLNQIEITEYELIDQSKGHYNTQKKVIAQQVREVLPNAISMSRKVIPSVYELARSFEYNAGVLRIQTDKAHAFVTGDKIDLKTPKQNLDNVEVLAIIDAHTFEVKAERKPENVFVYGKTVDDFHSVDYDAIAMLNVSASQEMYRMILDLQKTNSALSKENDDLKSSTVNLENRLSSLEAMMVKEGNKMLNKADNTGR